MEPNRMHANLFIVESTKLELRRADSDEWRIPDKETYADWAAVDDTNSEALNLSLVKRARVEEVDDIKSMRLYDKCPYRSAADARGRPHTMQVARSQQGQARCLVCRLGGWRRCGPPHQQFALAAGPPRREARMRRSSVGSEGAVRVARPSSVRRVFVP